jgi:hypothetical protein
VQKKKLKVDINLNNLSGSHHIDGETDTKGDKSKKAKKDLLKVRGGSRNFSPSSNSSS